MDIVTIGMGVTAGVGFTVSYFSLIALVGSLRRVAKLEGRIAAQAATIGGLQRRLSRVDETL